MKTVIIVQARMTSTRLPGKVLMPVLGKPMLEYQIERLRRVNRADTVVLATTVNATDDPVAALGERLGVPVFRGSEADVLARYHGAAQAVQADIVVRVTADCPLIEPDVADQCIEEYQVSQETCQPYHYVSNTLTRTYPQGLDCEVFSFDVLDEAFEEAAKDFEREHVTPFIYQRPERYRVAQVTQKEDWSEYRWTVDTPEDFELIRRIIEALYPANPQFNRFDAMALLDRHPDWRQLNEAIRQKKLGE